MGLVNCPKCGAEINETDHFCSSCGYDFDTPVASSDNKVEVTVSSNQDKTVEKKQTNGFAIAGFVLSLVGFVIAGIICEPLAVIFDGIALSQIKEKNQGGRGLAIAGLVIGIIGTIAMVIYFTSDSSSSYSILPFLNL